MKRKQRGGSDARSASVPVLCRREPMLPDWVRYRDCGETEIGGVYDWWFGLSGYSGVDL